MGIDISQLSTKAQKQCYDKLKLLNQIRNMPKTPKYNNVKTTVVAEQGEIKFDSKKEARRFSELKFMQIDGKIKNLRLQVEFTLQPAYTTITGERIRAIRYLADFTYDQFKLTENGNQWVNIVEDVKSKATKTASYKMKRKMMRERFGIDIQEI